MSNVDIVEVIIDDGGPDLVEVIERGPQGPVGPVGPGLDPIPAQTLLGNLTGSTAEPTGQDAVAVRDWLDTFTASEVAPTSPVAGDKWLNLNTSILYTWVVTGATGQWVDVGTSPVVQEYARSPVPTYDSAGVVTRIDYANGSYKTFTYTSGLLTQVDFVRPGLPTIRKTLSYTGEVWSGTAETEL